MSEPRRWSADEFAEAVGQAEVRAYNDGWRAGRNTLAGERARMLLVEQAVGSAEREHVVAGGDHEECEVCRIVGRITRALEGER